MKMKKRTKLAVSLLAVVLALACGKMKKASPETTPAASPSASTGLVLARVGGQDVTEEDVRKVAGPSLAQAELQLYEARKDGIDQVIDDRLMEEAAAKQGVAKAEFVKKNVSDKVQVNDKEIEKFYNENKAQMGGKKLDDVKTNIRGLLLRQAQEKYYGELTASLRKKSKVEILINAPRMEIEEGDNPAIGPKDAPVKIIEFTDYQCPFCGKARPTVNQILSDYKGKVRYILRDFPLSFHKDSVKAHEAAHCAGEQNKYWDMNKKLFGDQKNIKPDDLQKYAGEIHLNMDKFNTCLNSGKYTALIQQNQSYGESVGVSGTPAFFINGRMVSGARPFAAFKEIIDDELSRKD